MNLQSDLKLAWCSHRAAKYAVDHWHYSKTMPVSKRVLIGVWEEGRFIGTVIFSLGATPALGRPYGCKKFECCELVRVALNKHRAPVTRILAIAIRMLKCHSPLMRLIVSFADTNQGHLGCIYQAGNWIYSGCSGNNIGLSCPARLITVTGTVT